MTFVFCHFYFVFYLWTVNVKSWRVFEWLMGVVVFYARFPPHREQLWTTSPVMLCCADVFRIRADSWAALRVTRVGETLYLNQIIFLYISLTIIHWFIKWLRNIRLLLKLTSISAFTLFTVYVSDLSMSLELFQCFLCDFTLISSVILLQWF